MNLIGFYIGWWAIAFLGSKDLSSAIVLTTSAILLLHLWIQRRNFKKEVITILTITILGSTLDYLLHFLKLFNLQKDYAVWLTAIWLIFTCTLRHSMTKLFQQNNFILFIISFIGGPLSYIMASNFNLIEYPLLYSTIIPHGIVWGFFALIMKLIIRKIK